MKTLFIPTEIRYNINSNEIREISKKLLKNIAIAYSIQYNSIALSVKKALSKNHNITKFSQVLGCSKLDIPKDTQAILLITDGRFHALSLAFDLDAEQTLPIYILERNNLIELSKQEIDDFKKTQKARYMNFLNADRIGISVSLKPGQENLEKALELKKALTKKHSKESYLFLGNDLVSSELENFPLIKSWVNTACPRFDMEDNRIINVEDL